MVFLWSYSCRHESNEIAQLDEICFETEILPVFLTNCAISGCHDKAGESEYTFTNDQNIIKAVVPGNSSASPAYKSLIISGQRKI